VRLQIIAICGLFLGCGLLLGAFFAAKGRIVHSIKREEDECDHKWANNIDCQQCQNCYIKRKKERRWIGKVEETEGRRNA